MRERTGVTLFPFLSVLLCTMGILAFLAVTFLLISRVEVDVAPAEEPVEVRWVGAPEYVRPLLVECRAERVRVHDPAYREPRVFTLGELQDEARVVRDIEFAGLAELGGMDRQRQLRFVKSRIRSDGSLRGSLTRALDRVETDNQQRQQMGGEEAHYPVLLVYRDGIESYEIVSYLVETTTRLSMGLEPMLKDWTIPYRSGASARM